MFGFLFRNKAERVVTELVQEGHYKAAEEYLVEAIQSGSITFHKRYINDDAEFGYKTHSNVLKIYREYSPGGCSFDYFIIDRKDVDPYMSGPRVAYLLRTGVDVGPRPPCSTLVAGKWISPCTTPTYFQKEPNDIN